MMDSFMPQKPPWWNVLPGGNVQEKGRWAKLSSQPWSWMIKTRSSSDIFRLIPLVPSNASPFSLWWFYIDRPALYHLCWKFLTKCWKLDDWPICGALWGLWSCIERLGTSLFIYLDSSMGRHSSADLEKRQPAAVNDVSPEWKRAVPLNKSRRLDNHLGDG